MKVLQLKAIQKLKERAPVPGSPVLSVYVDFDPSQMGSRRGEHKLLLDQMLKDLETRIEGNDKLRHFQEDADWVRQEMEFRLPKGKSLAIFCDVSESLMVVEDLPVRVVSQACHLNTPYVRPILQARDECERYGVVLIDRERARFFVIAMGYIEEVAESSQSPPVKHRSTAGSDHMRSQMVLQRRAATWSNWFLRDVTDLLGDIIREHEIDRLLLAGPEDVTADLQRFLPKTSALKVAGRIRAPVGARAGDLLEVALPVIRQIEMDRQRVLVEDLVTIAQKVRTTGEKAVLGLSQTLDAVTQGRVHQLVYPSGLKLAGWRCRSCEVLLDHAPIDGKCPYCSKALDEEPDLVWRAAESVLEAGGRIEEIQGEELCARMEAVGRMGAYLR